MDWPVPKCEFSTPTDGSRTIACRELSLERTIRQHTWQTYRLDQRPGPTDRAQRLPLWIPRFNRQSTSIDCRAFGVGHPMSGGLRTTDTAEYRHPDRSLNARTKALASMALSQ